MRRAAKVDGNHSEVVDALRAIGAEVQSLAAVGNGVPDLLVCFRGSLFLLEVKDGRKPPSHRKLTKDQEAFHLRWPVKVVTSPEDAIRAVGVVSVRTVEMGTPEHVAIIRECYRRGAFSWEDK